VASVFKTTVLNTSKEMMSYSDFPAPAHWAPFIHHTKVHVSICMGFILWGPKDQRCLIAHLSFFHILIIVRVFDETGLY